MPKFFRQSSRRSYDLLSSYSFYLPGIGGVLMLLLMLLAGACLGNLLILLLTFMTDIRTATDYGMLISYPVMFLPPMWYASYQSRRNQFFDTGYALDSSHFGNLKGWGMALMVTVVTWACSFITDPVVSVLPDMPEELKTMFEQMMQDGPLWVTVVSTVIFAPIFEEWLCRGMVLRGLLQKVHPAWAMVISALFFALIHLNPWQAVPAFVTGILLAYVYYRTGSLKLTILMHAVNNGTSVIISQLPALKALPVDASLLEFMDRWQYISLMAACLFIIVIFIDIVRKNVPLQSERGNCDMINPEDSL
ncbi:MAG: CPBP family intramembrane metalloprotease [Bacteroidetes bacterium]|uniref:CPBP family intramembrane metalloprotease n=1 Tax=Candidatus Cryptobacteroides faecavium TaxID=2840762 RepID=A0A9D9IE89_9BACT|nr:CPBP family intramembrane metalloprotease [Candidatus Cryptobacteroides faecavium]